MFNGDYMRKIIEKVSLVLNELKENKYSYQDNENTEIEQQKFFILQDELFNCFNKVYMEIEKNSKILDSKISNRFNNINKLKGELEYYSDSSNPSTVEYVESLALFTEI